LNGVVTVMSDPYREWVQSLKEFCRATNHLIDTYIDEIENGLISTFIGGIALVLIVGLLRQSTTL